MMMMMLLFSQVFASVCHSRNTEYPKYDNHSILKNVSSKLRLKGSFTYLQYTILIWLKEISTVITCPIYFVCDSRNFPDNRLGIYSFLSPISNRYLFFILTIHHNMAISSCPIRFVRLLLPIQAYSLSSVGRGGGSSPLVVWMVVRVHCCRQRLPPLPLKDGHPF